MDKDRTVERSQGEQRKKPSSRLKAFWERCRLLPSARPLRFGFEATIVIWLITLVVIYRLLTLEEIEIGGDALKVWEFARHLAHGGTLPDKLNHHTSRFGLVVPALLVQWKVGSAATSYFIGPVMASAVLHLFVYLTVRRLGGIAAGLVTVFLLLEFQPLVRASSQILPETFGPAYISVAFYLATIFHDQKRRLSRMMCLGGALIFIFAAYGAKMVFLYFAPGLALLFWLGGSTTMLTQKKNMGGRVGKGIEWLRARGLLIPIALTLGVFGLLVIEWGIFSSVTESAGGRFEVMTGSHAGKPGSGPRIHEFSDFFKIYTNAPTEWTRAVVAGSLALVGLLAFARDKRSKLLALALIIFAALQVFVIRRLDPLTAWAAPHPRYLSAMTPLIATVIGIFLHESISKVYRDLSHRFRWMKTVGPTIGLTGVILALTQFTFSMKTEWKSNWGRKGAWKSTEVLSGKLTKQFNAGWPIISSSPRGKPAWAAGAVLIHPDALKAKDGTIHPSRKFLRKLGSGLYLAKDQGKKMSRSQRTMMDRVVKRRKRSKRCYVAFEQRFRFTRFRMYRSNECSSLAEELKNKPQSGAPFVRSSKKRRQAKKKKGPLGKSLQTPSERSLLQPQSLRRGPQ